MKGIYAGTFDPPTNGHLWMMEQGVRIFDKFVVAIGINPKKQTAFSLEERTGMLRDLTKHHSNTSISSFKDKYLVHYAQSIHATHILRGIRNLTDYEYECAMMNINADLNPEIKTVFLMPPRELIEVSSSTVKGLVGPFGWEEVVRKYIPDIIYQRFVEKFKNAQ